MKRIAIVLSVAILVGVTSWSLAGIQGSAHDFSDESWSEGELCLPCHVPHSGTAGPAPAGISPRTYMLYKSRRGVPGRSSLMCLSCHDGSTAFDVASEKTAHLAAKSMRRRAIIGRGGDLSRDHPIGVVYPDLNPKFRPRNLIEAEGEVLLFDNRVECMSCHDPHNAAGYKKMLRKSNQRSRLCLTCHRM